MLQDHNTTDQVVAQSNGSATNLQTSTPSPDLLGDLLSPLAIEGPPGASVESEQNSATGSEGTSIAVDALALATVGDQTNTVQVRLFVAVLFIK